jgi:uncharacterized OB-fold protein
MNRKAEEEILIGQRNFDSIFSYTAGIVRSKFLTEIRDNKKIIGTKCPNCDIIWVPARSTCMKCFGSLKEFVEVGNVGIVTTYSVINEFQEYYPMKPPFVLGIIQLEGASTGLVHFIGEVNPNELKIGMKVNAVFNKKRIGSILDIKYFKPVID